MASSAWDEFDRPEPPVIGEFVSVYFPHPQWGELSKNYCTDFRPEISDGEIWGFEVKTNIRDAVYLTFEGIKAVPSEYKVWLLDPMLQTSQNLNQNARYSFAASVEHRKRLQLLSGHPGFVEDKLLVTETIPQTFELSQNFPNPFNPTTIRYGQPEESRVTIRLYNTLGQEIVTLVNSEVQSAGFHAIVWNGRNATGTRVGSGLYFYQLLTDETSLIRKMVIVL